MARLARVVVPGVAHHVTQRGNRRHETFFGEEAYAAYLSLPREWCERCGVEVWAYCLMPNHVHLIVVPDGEDGLRRALSEPHRRYTRRISFRQGRRGYLWQGRFLAGAVAVKEGESLRCHTRTGRPLGQPAFLDRVERTLRRIIRPAKPGRKKRRNEYYVP